MAAADTANIPSIRFELLDGLRFVAALSVMFFHLAFRSWNMNQPGYIEYPLLGEAAKYGYLGVDLFFMISGFVILMSASKGGAGSYLLSRIVRLYPAYWFCVGTTFTFLTYWHWNTTPQLAIKNLLVNLTMLQTFFDEPHVDGSYWTLAVELHFYALILILLISKQLAHIDRVLALWLLAGIAADFLPDLKAYGELYAASWCHYFIGGALAYRLRFAGFNLFRLFLRSCLRTSGTARPLVYDAKATFNPRCLQPTCSTNRHCAVVRDVFSHRAGALAVSTFVASPVGRIDLPSLSNPRSDRLEFSRSMGS